MGIFKKKEYDYDKEFGKLDKVTEEYDTARQAKELVEATTHWNEFAENRDKINNMLQSAEKMESIHDKFAARGIEISDPTFMVEGGAYGFILSSSSLKRGNEDMVYDVVYPIRLSLVSEEEYNVLTDARYIESYNEMAEIEGRDKISVYTYASEDHQGNPITTYTIEFPKDYNDLSKLASVSPSIAIQLGERAAIALESAAVSAKSFAREFKAYESEARDTLADLQKQQINGKKDLDRVPVGERIAETAKDIGDGAVHLAKTAGKGAVTAAKAVGKGALTIVTAPVALAVKGVVEAKDAGYKGFLTMREYASDAATQRAIRKDIKEWQDTTLEMRKIIQDEKTPEYKALTEMADNINKAREALGMEGTFSLDDYNKAKGFVGAAKNVWEKTGGKVLNKISTFFVEKRDHLLKPIGKVIAEYESEKHPKLARAVSEGAHKLGAARDACINAAKAVAGAFSDRAVYDPETGASSKDTEVLNCLRNIDDTAKEIEDLAKRAEQFRDDKTAKKEDKAKNTPAKD